MVAVALTRIAARMTFNIGVTGMLLVLSLAMIMQPLRTR
jgi:hypothetical protein